jgi:glycosyltransferase involved in cell wall biosynthesis
VQLLRFLREERIDVVNVHYPHDNYVYFAICRRLLPIKLVTSVHGRDAFYRERPFERYSRPFRQLVHASDLIILPSDSYRRKFLDGFPEMQDRTIFIHNSVDTVRFTSRTQNTRQKGASRYVLCVAELQDYKAIDVLLHAARPLLERDPSLLLKLAGNGPQREELASLALTLGIEKQTVFLGTQNASEIVSLLHGAELMVLPSRMEPFGIVLLEAMACTVPVVATRAGGIPEIVEHEVSGLLVEPDDPAALTSAIDRVLADDGLSRRLAENGHARVMAQFRAEHQGAAYLDALASTIRGEQPASRSLGNLAAATARDRAGAANVR